MTTSTSLKPLLSFSRCPRLELCSANQHSLTLSTMVCGLCLASFPSHSGPSRAEDIHYHISAAGWIMAFTFDSKPEMTSPLVCSERPGEMRGCCSSHFDFHPNMASNTLFSRLFLGWWLSAQYSIVLEQKKKSKIQRFQGEFLLHEGEIYSPHLTQHIWEYMWARSITHVAQSM